MPNSANAVDVSDVDNAVVVSLGNIANVPNISPLDITDSVLSTSRGISALFSWFMV